MGYLTLMETVTFTVSLPADAFQLAEKFSISQKDERRVQQIRLNTLAVYAVSFYCRCMEVETELDNSNGGSFIFRDKMNVADLRIKNVGKLECIPVLPDAKICYVPREAWNSRIGYVVVQIDEKACVATLLGFVQQVTTEELPLSQLESLEDLIDCLEPLPEPDFVRLSQWFDDIFYRGWQPEDLVVARRTRSKRDANRLQVNAAKVMRLGIQIPEETVTLIVKQRKLSEQEVDICLRLYPGNDSLYLPDGVKLTVLDELNEPIPSLEVQARADNWLQLQFTGAIEDKFSIKVSLAANSVIENFII